MWIIDPIDGTMNFVHQKRNFAISIGIFENGVGKIGLIYDVIHDELYHAIKGEGAYMNDILLPPLKDVEIEKPLWVLIRHGRLKALILTPNHLPVLCVT